MPEPSTAGKWWSLPSRLALLMGFGALSAASAEAGLTGISGENMFGSAIGGAAVHPGESAANRGSFLRIREGAIEIAEGSGRFRELRLGDTTEARHLKRLLENNHAARSEAGVRLEPTILAGAGGEGFHWNPIPRNSRDDARPGRSDKPSPPRRPASEKGVAPEAPGPTSKG